MNHKVKIIARKITEQSKVMSDLYARISAIRINKLKAMSDEEFLKKMYYENTGVKLNLEEPRTFNEKLLWLNLHDRNPLYTKLADKYEVRQFVKEKIGDKYLVPLIGIYNKVEEIPFSELPEEYAIKCTHDCGSVILQGRNKIVSEDEIKNKIGKALLRNYYYVGRIWCYKNIVPRIIIENIIQTENNEPPKDYKVFCFYGEPKFLFVASDRGKGTKFDFFDLDWNRIPVRQHYPNSSYVIEKPSNFAEMLECARKLSVGIPQVRVDFYVDKDGNLLFGEMTMCQFAGTELFEPEEYNYIFGEYIDLALFEAK